MKTKALVGLLVGIIAVALSPVTRAAGQSGRGGGSAVGGVGGHSGGAGGAGRAVGGGAPRSAGPGFRSAPYYYSRGMHFAQPRGGQFRSPVRQSPSVASPNRGVNNSAARTAGRA